MRRGEQIPGPGSPSDLHVCYQVHQQKGRSARSPLSTQTSPDPHRLPEPGWAPSWGQVSSYCPGWARPGPEGLLGHLLRGGRWGRGLAQGSGLRVLGVPSGEFWLERRQRPNCRSQLPAPTRRSSPPFPTRLLPQPPTARCSFLWQPGNAAHRCPPWVDGRGRPLSAPRRGDPGTLAHLASRCLFAASTLGRTFPPTPPASAASLPAGYAVLLLQPSHLISR